MPDAALAKGSRRLRCARCGTEWRTAGATPTAVVTPSVAKPNIRWQPPAEEPAPGFKPPGVTAAPPPRPAQAAQPPAPPPIAPPAPPPYAPPAAAAAPPPSRPPPAPPAPPPAPAAPSGMFAPAAREAPEPPASPAFTPAPPFTVPPAFAAAFAPAASYGAAPAPTPAAAPPPDEPFAPPAPARTIEEERERLAADRDAYAPLDATVSRAWPPLAQEPELGGAAAEAAAPEPAWTAEPPASFAPFTPAAPPPPEPAAYSATGAPLPQFLIPDPPAEPPPPPAPAAQLPATADRFAELVYAARNRSIEFEPDALRERPANRAPLLALVLASVVVAVSLLQYRSIEAYIPVTTGIFKAVGLR